LFVSTETVLVFYLATATALFVAASDTATRMFSFSDRLASVRTEVVKVVGVGTGDVNNLC
jgi:hypothetical protein